MQKVPSLPLIGANIRALLSPTVIPAEAGIQSFQCVLDPRFSGAPYSTGVKYLKLR